MDWLHLLQFFFLVSAVRSALVWNTGGDIALFIAIAIPIDLPTRHVFLSYNFEAIYRLPRTWRKRPYRYHHGFNGTHEHPLEDFEDYYEDYDEHGPHHGPPKRKRPRPRPTKHGHKHKHKPKPKPKPTPLPKPVEDYKDFFEDAWARKEPDDTLLSRTKFYKILSHRFEQHGLGRGDDCLLRLICEANSAQLGDNNGVLGSLIHVMFSPSHSRREALPASYYEAERHGKDDNCAGYGKKCPSSVLDMITRPLMDYIGNKTALL